MRLPCGPVSLPLPGGETAIYNSSGTLAAYRHADWLGSSRLTTATPSRTVSSSSAYAPFGEQYATSGPADASFTGQNADTNSGLYDFTFREYSPSQGRWVSPDPAGVAAANPANPQSWNRYAYVNNNPLSHIDPKGLACQLAEDGTFINDTCIAPWYSADYNGPPPTPQGFLNDAIPIPWSPFTAPTHCSGLLACATTPTPEPTPQQPKPGICTNLEHAGATTSGLGTAVFLWGSLADTTFIGATIGVPVQTVGSIGMAVGALGYGIGDAGIALGICH